MRETQCVATADALVGFNHAAMAASGGWCRLRNFSRDPLDALAEKTLTLRSGARWATSQTGTRQSSHSPPSGSRTQQPARQRAPFLPRACGSGQNSTDEGGSRVAPARCDGGLASRASPRAPRVVVPHVFYALSLFIGRHEEEKLESPPPFDGPLAVASGQ